MERVSTKRSTIINIKDVRSVRSVRNIFNAIPSYRETAVLAAQVGTRTTVDTLKPCY